MLEKLAAFFRNSDLDNRLLVPLLVSTTLVQTVTSLVRVTTSYRAVELNLSIVWLGLIAATLFQHSLDRSQHLPGLTRNILRRIVQDHP